MGHQNQWNGPPRPNGPIRPPNGPPGPPQHRPMVSNISAILISFRAQWKTVTKLHLSLCDK